MSNPLRMYCARYLERVLNIFTSVAFNSGELQLPQGYHVEKVSCSMSVTQASTSRPRRVCHKPTHDSCRTRPGAIR